ncbi:hypothetical protein ACVWZK_001598 [Bradyrhizobium sp. GM0.4]
MATIQDFLISEAGRDSIDREFASRLIRSGARILTLHNLLRFARERWPNNYPRDYRESTAEMPCGREAMRELWGKYLHWCDEEALQDAGDA